MSFFSNFTNFFIVKPASWLAGRFSGTAAATAVTIQVQTAIQREIDAAKPILLDIVNGAVIELDAIATATIDLLRGKIISGLPAAKLSADATATVVATINQVAAPVEIATSAAVSTFATAVKAAISAL